MKTAKIIFWITTSFIVAFEGLMPLSALLFSPEQMTIGTRPLGYPDYFAVTLIIFKVTGAVILMIPRTPRWLKEWSYAGFTFNFLFACISHWAVGGFGFLTILPLIILSILLVSYHYYQKIGAASRAEAGSVEMPASA